VRVTADAITTIGKVAKAASAKIFSAQAGDQRDLVLDSFGVGQAVNQDLAAVLGRKGNAVALINALAVPLPM